MWLAAAMGQASCQIPDCFQPVPRLSEDVCFKRPTIKQIFEDSASKEVTPL